MDLKNRRTTMSINKIGFLLLMSSFASLDKVDPKIDCPCCYVCEFFGSDEYEFYSLDTED